MLVPGIQVIFAVSGSSRAREHFEGTNREKWRMLFQGGITVGRIHYPAVADAP